MIMQELEVIRYDLRLCFKLGTFLDLFVTELMIMNPFQKGTFGIRSNTGHVCYPSATGLRNRGSWSFNNIEKRKTSTLLSLQRNKMIWEIFMPILFVIL